MEKPSETAAPSNPTSAQPPNPADVSALAGGALPQIGAGQAIGLASGALPRPPTASLLTLPLDILSHLILDLQYSLRDTFRFAKIRLAEAIVGQSLAHLTGALPGGLTSAVPGGLAGAVPGGLASAVPGGLTGAVPGGLTGAVPGGLTGAVPGGLTGAVPGAESAGGAGSVVGKATGAVPKIPGL